MRKGHSSRNHAAAERVGLVVCGLLLGLALIGCGRSELELSTSADGPTDVRVARMISAYYGDALASVRVDPGAVDTGGRGGLLPDADVSCSASTTQLPRLENLDYAGEYRLRGLPLRFPFRVPATASEMTAEQLGGAEGERSLLHNDIGGVDRFAKLARRFHVDFPRETSMSYWRTSDNDVAVQEPYRSILRSHPGPSVMVYEFDDYYGDETSKQLGIYWWNSNVGGWTLIHRGELPDLR